MVTALHLAAALEQCISPYLPAAAVKMEMQVAAMLAQMESVGMGAYHVSILYIMVPLPLCALHSTSWIRMLLWRSNML